MADSDLIQVEADALIALEKRRVGEQEWRYPDFGGAITIPLVSTDRRELFFLDLRRSRIDPWRTLGDFMQFCNVVEPPVIRRGLFT